MGFEVVVRPVVLPDIRPVPTQSRAPADDPDQGLATINGSSGQFLDLQYSWSSSSSQSNPREIKRRFDVMRVYQKDDNGTVNRDNFVDVEVANKVWMEGSPVTQYFYAPAQEADNIELRERNKIKSRE